MKLTNPVDVLMKEPYAFLLYGPPGCGKTTLAAQAENPIIIACPINESISLAKLPNAKDIRVIGVDSWKDLEETVQIVIKGSAKLGDYKSLILDNLTYAYSFAVDQALSDQRTDVISQATWTTANRMMTDLLFDILTLKDKHVILVAHHRREKDKNDNVQIMPDFGESLARKIVGRLNACFYYRLVGEQRKLTVSAAAGIDVKSRYDLGRELINPKWSTVVDLLDKYKEKIKGQNV